MVGIANNNNLLIDMMKTAKTTTKNNHMKVIYYEDFRNTPTHPLSTISIHFFLILTILDDSDMKLILLIVTRSVLLNQSYLNIWDNSMQYISQIYMIMMAIPVEIFDCSLIIISMIHENVAHCQSQSSVAITDQMLWF